MVSENEHEAGSISCLGAHPSVGSFPKSDRTFSPENIFWNPEERAIGKSCHPLWEKSLNLGWSLLKASLHYSPQWSREEFRQYLETLRAEVKNAMFQGKTLAESQSEGCLEGRSYHLKGDNSEGLLDEYPSAPGYHEKNDGAIHDILTRIMSKWRAAGADLDEKSFAAGARAVAAGEAGTGGAGAEEGRPAEHGSGEHRSGEEELAAWASSNGLGKWAPSHAPDEWESHHEIGEVHLVTEEGAADIELDQDNLLAEATVTGSNKKFKDKKRARK
jgi:hypothetical protein